MIPPLDPDTGALPLGRHVATLSEVQNQFTTTDQRNDLWKKFLTVTGMFRGEGSVCAVWLSGSYLTSKEMPHDVDAVYWLCLLYTSPSPRDLSTSRMPSSA